MATYYDVLGVSSDASQEEIKKKWRELTIKWHPDTNHDKNAEEKYKEINAAYEVLGNPESRRKYDASLAGGIPGDFGSGDFGFGFDPFNMRDSVFGSFFRNRDPFANGNARNRPKDVHINARVSVKDAYKGTTLEVEYNTGVICDTCHGTGAKDGKVVKCHVCNGTGQVSKRIVKGNSQVTMYTTCEHCGGTGKIPSAPCDKCHGTGIYRERVKSIVEVHPGVRNGEVIVLYGTKGKPDLYVHISITNTNEFITDPAGSLNIVRPLRVDYVSAILGDTMTIKSIDGKRNIKVEIHEGMQNAHQVLIRGEGLKTDSETGDMIVVCEIDIPTPDKVSANEKKLLEKIKKSRK